MPSFDDWWGQDVLPSNFSNQPPTNSESTLIIQKIQIAQAQATHLSEILAQRRRDDKTSRASEMVTMYRIGQANLFVRQHVGVVSVVRRLPSERYFCGLQNAKVDALIETTWCCAPMGVRPNFSILEDGYSEPALWRRFPTVYLNNSSARTKLQIQYVNELLRRSRGALLDIGVVDGFDWKTHPILDLLCQHAERDVFAVLLSTRDCFLELESVNCWICQSLGSRYWTRISMTVSKPPRFLRQHMWMGQFNRYFLPLDQLLHYQHNISTSGSGEIATIVNTRVLKILVLSSQLSPFLPRQCKIASTISYYPPSKKWGWFFPVKIYFRASFGWFLSRSPAHWRDWIFFILDPSSLANCLIFFCLPRHWLCCVLLCRLLTRIFSISPLAILYEPASPPPL